MFKAKSFPFALILLSIVMLGFNANLGAQNVSKPLELLSGSRFLKQNVIDFSQSAVTSEELVAGHYYKYVYFKTLPNQTQRTRLGNMGLKFLAYLPQNTYIVAFPADFDKTKILNNYSVESVSSILPADKLHPKINERPLPSHAVKQGQLSVLLEFHSNLETDKVVEELIRFDLKILNENYSPNTVELKIKVENLLILAAKPYVAFISIIPEEGQPEDLRGRIFHRSNVLKANYGGARNYDGTGVNIAVLDDGFIGPHIDFQGRTSQADVAGFNIGTHGDRVTSVASGAGNLDPDGEGMAPGAFCHILAYQGSNGSVGALNWYINSNVRVFNTSYSDGCNSGYTNRTRTLDTQTRDYPELLHVYSAGNDGQSDCGYGAGSNWGNVTGGHKVGKNVIATANLNVNGSAMSSSSRGPAEDGRIKPDISANGNIGMAALPNNEYTGTNGTSFSAPSIAGVAAQLYQAYKELNGNTTPRADLIKAILLNTSEDIGNPGPDFIYGWGRVNALRAVQTIENGQYITGAVDQGGQTTHTLNIPTDVKEVKVMLYWHDEPGALAASKALVNDLDFTIETPSANTLLPYLLDPTPTVAALSSPATNGVDRLNNMEQIRIEDPASGNYTLKVDGFQVPFGPQNYVLVYQYVYDDIIITYPIGGEFLTSNSIQRVIWDAPKGTQPFTIEYTVDNGDNWISLGTTPPTQHFYDWQIGNLITAGGKIRVTRDNVFGESIANFSVIGRPRNLQAYSTSANNITLRWNAVPGATGYEVFALGAKYMESVGSTNSTEYNFNLNTSSQQWLTVKALGPNGVIGKRAVAVPFDPNFSGVEFFADKNLVCEGKTIQFTDLSSFTGTSWNWQILPVSGFQFVNGTSANSQNPQIRFDNSGSYTIRLNVITPAGPFNLLKNAFIRVLNSPEPDIIEDFDQFSFFPPADWLLYNPDAFNQWQTVEVTGTDGQITNAAFFDNFNHSHLGQEDGLITSSYDLRTVNEEVNLKFDLAYAPGVNLSDELRIDISTDCGETFQPTGYLKSGVDIGTVASATTLFQPTSASHWKTDSLELTPWLGQQIQLRFVNISQGQNGLYLDNIQLEKTGVISGNESLVIQEDWRLAPNPTEGIVTVQSSLAVTNPLSISLFDVQGRFLARQNIQIGSSEVQFDLTDYPTGVYLIQLLSEGKSQTFKVVKQ